MSIVIVWLFFAILVGVYASRRGRSGVGWFLLATIISPLLAFLLCLALGPLQTATAPGMPSPDTHVRCPDCRELVLHDARVCKHCGAKLVPQEAPAVDGQVGLQVRNDLTKPPSAPISFAQVWQRNKAVIIVLAIIGLLAVSSMTR